MSQVYVVEECEITDAYEPCYDNVLGLVTSIDLGLRLVTERHPGLVMENEETTPGGLQFALRGKGMAEDGDDLYFCIKIKAFAVDPKSFGPPDYNAFAGEDEPDELNEGD